MVDNIAQYLVDKRKLLFWVSLLVVTLIAVGAKNIWIQSDYKAFFSDTNPQLLAHRNIQDTYTDTDNLLFIVDAKGQSVFSEQGLDLVGDITEKAWTTPYSLRVDSVTNYQYSYGDEDELIVEALLDIGGGDNPDYQKIRNIALSEPLLRNNLISPDGTVTAVNVMLGLPDPADMAVREVVAYGRDIVSSLEEKYPGFDIYLQGTAAVNHAFIESSEKDAMTLMPVMFMVILIILVLWLRSVKGTLITLLVINLSSAVAVGFCGWLNIAINQINVIAPTVIMTLAICDCVHLLVSYFERLSHGMEPEAAMKESLTANLQPVFLTSFTTAIGFLCINFSESPPLAEMGTITAVGVIAAFWLSVALIPFLGIRFIKGSNGVNPAASKVVTAFSGFLLRPKNPVFWVTLLVSALLVTFLFRNDIDDNYIKYFSHDTEIRQAAQFTQDNLTGIDTLAFSFSSGKENGIANPEFLEAVQAFVTWAQAQPEVVHVDSYIDILKRLNKNMHGDQAEWYRIPDERELASQYTLLYELSLPFGLDLNNQISFDKSSLLVNLRLKVDKAKEIIALDERAGEWLKTNYPEIHTNGASVSLMFAHLGKSNISNMMYGNVVGILLISLTLMLALRSFKYGLISLLPNAMPAAVALGLWGIFVAEVNIAVAVVFSVTLGIVVDDTVHFLSKYIKARRDLGKSSEESVVYAFEQVGKALVITSVVLAIGFFVLALSDFTVNSSMGLMVGVTIIVALLFDFLFLPTLLMKVDRK